METIRIQFQANLKSKILELLSSFSENEVQIIQEDPFFEKNKKILEDELKNIENGKSKCISMEELDLVMEKIISKYED
jgi:uridine kinase